VGIWNDLYGSEFAERGVLVESGLRKGGVYRRAWKWALSKDREERAEIFSKLTGSG